MRAGGLEAATEIIERAERRLALFARQEAFLDISQPELATAANVGLSTLRDFEAGRRTPVADNLEAIRAVLEAQSSRRSIC